MIVGIALVIAIGGFAGVIAHKLGQPPLVGYLIAGIVMASLDIGLRQAGELAEPLGELGLIFLLFIAGMEIKPGITKGGKEPFIIAGGQIGLSILFGLVLVLFLLGLELRSALFVAIALMFSSTVIVFRVLSQNKEEETPHGKILMVMMIIQDIFAIAILIVYNPAIAQGDGDVLWLIMRNVIGLLATFGILFIIGRKLISPHFRQISKSYEMVFITGLLWCFCGVIIASILGVSIELAAFIAGISIAGCGLTYQIEDKMKPLRDFGLLLFFAFIATKATWELSMFVDLSFWVPFIILLIFVLLGIPLIILLLCSFLKYPKRITFLSAFYPGQASEFGLILMSLGVIWGVVTEEILSLVAMVTVVSIIISSIHIRRIKRSYRRWQSRLSFLEWRGIIRTSTKVHYKGHVVILGIKDIKAREVLKRLVRSGHHVVVVDWDRNVHSWVEGNGVEKEDIIEADANDRDLWEYLNLRNARLVLSTIENNIEGDIGLIRWLKQRPKRPLIITETNDHKEAKQMEGKADYVCYPDKDALPHLLKWIAHKRL